MSTSPTDQYVAHVAGQLTRHLLPAGGEQVVLASQDRRRGNGLDSQPLSVIVLPPAGDRATHVVTDNGYTVGVVGRAALEQEKTLEMLLWHVVEVDPTTGHLLAEVDHATHVGQRIHDLEQAMLDVLRYAVRHDASTDLVSASRTISRLAPSGTASFRDDARACVDLLAEQLPALTWAVALVDDDGTWSPVAAAGGTYDDLLDVAVPWDQTVCAAHDRGDGPTAAPDLSAVPAYAAAPAASLLGLGCWLGSSICTPDGRVVGSVCGLGRQAVPAELLAGHVAQVRLLALLLARSYEVEQQATPAR